MINKTMVLNWNCNKKNKNSRIFKKSILDKNLLMVVVKYLLLKDNYYVTAMKKKLNGISNKG